MGKTVEYQQSLVNPEKEYRKKKRIEKQEEEEKMGADLNSPSESKSRVRFRAWDPPRRQKGRRLTPRLFCAAFFHSAITRLFLSPCSRSVSRQLLVSQRMNSREYDDADDEVEEEEDSPHPRE